MVSGVKRRIYEIMEVASVRDTTSWYFDLFMVALITTNVIVVCLETIPGLEAHYLFFFAVFDTVSVAIFTVEFGLRLWTATENERFRQPVTGRLRYLATPLAIVDLIAILPFYVMLFAPLFIPVDLRFMRVVRLSRLFRLLKLGEYSEAVQTLPRVLVAKKAQLGATFFILVIALVFSASIMYYAEHEAQPEEFASIPHAMWWGVVTLATVGYGDVTPITPMGKVIGGIVAMIGIGVFALPAGIFASGFAEELESRRHEPTVCPHCGKRLDDLNGRER
ncbi:MAG: ion transporter [Methanobacteriota archaeon]|nr:MAG: ion transporter [Euryarchaeota archaeon]